MSCPVISVRREPNEANFKSTSMQRRARRMVLLLVGVFACLSVVSTPTESVALSPVWTVGRGRLVGHGAYGPNTPVGGMRLTLYNNKFGRSSLVVSRPNGSFAFRNIPLGRYFVEIWFSEQTLPENIRIQDKSSPSLRYRHNQTLVVGNLLRWPLAQIATDESGAMVILPRIGIAQPNCTLTFSNLLVAAH